MADTKIAVTKTFDENYMLMFEEEDIRKACKAADCSTAMIEVCITNMKEGADDCTCCFINLLNIIKAEPEFIPIIPKNGRKN